MRLHEDIARGRINREAVGHEQVTHKGQEDHQEGHSLDGQAATTSGAHLLVADVVDEIEQRQHTGEEEDGGTKEQVPHHERSLEPVPRRGPTRDDRHTDVRQLHAVHDERGAAEERAHGRAQQERAQDTIDKEEHLVRAFAEQVAPLSLKLIRYGLQHEAQQDDRPHPIGAAEAGGVKQREGGEEGAAEGHERRERELPLAADGVDQQLLLPLRAADGEEQRLPALYEHEEHQQRAKQRHEQPPVVLKKAIRYIHETMC